MGKLVAVLNTAHSPFCYLPPEWWNELRAKRPIRADVPLDDLEENKRKWKRIQEGFGVLRASLAEAQPDVIVIFGDDQVECFDFTNFPSFAVYVGDEYEGFLSDYDAARRNPSGAALGEPPKKQRVRNHPEFAKSILAGLMERGFDPAFCLDMPKPEYGIGHAILRPAESLTDFDVPVVPILVNCYFAPQPTANRCYQLGRAVRQIIDSYPGDLRVAVVGSGGLWHTPRVRDSYLDEDFDRAQLQFLKSGDIRGMGDHFDSYQIPDGDTSQDYGIRGHESTGMPSSSGPQGGTRETCNWIAAAAVADGSPSFVVDYVPLYAAPVGAAFTYCLEPQPL